MTTSPTLSQVLSGEARFTMRFKIDYIHPGFIAAWRIMARLMKEEQKRETSL